MSEKKYESALAAARKDLHAAYAQREELERKIAKLRQMVATLGSMMDEKGLDTFKFLPRSGNLTETVRNAVIASMTPLGAVDIRNVLVDLGYRFQTANPLGSIHAVLGRLVEQEQLVPVRAVLDGKVGRDIKYWYGNPSYLEHWIPADAVQWDAERKAFVLKKRSGEK